MKKADWIKILLLIPLFGALQYSCSKSNTVPQGITSNGGGGDTTGGGGNVTFSNVVYATNTDWQGHTVQLTLDVYQPPNMVAGKKYPLIMNMHGGGYVEGDKSTDAYKCQLLADSGFIAVAINYRLGWDNGGGTLCAGDTASFNEAAYRAMQDANAAMRFLVSKANDYSIDTSWIFIAGASAGADVALTSTYINDAYAKVRYPKPAAKFGGLKTAGNNLTNKYTIKGICAIAGALEDSTLINRSQAYPCISFQGELDEVVPINFGYYLGCTNYPFEVGSLCQYRQLVALNVPAIANILPGQGHGNNGDSGYDNPFMMGSTACFFHTLINKRKPSTGIYIGTINTCAN